MILLLHYYFYDLEETKHLLRNIIPYCFFDTDSSYKFCLLVSSFRDSVFSISQSAGGWPAACELPRHLHFLTRLLESLGISVEIPEHHAASPWPTETSTYIGHLSPQYEYWKEQLALFVPANSLWPPRGHWPCELRWGNSDETQDSEEDRGVPHTAKGGSCRGECGHWPESTVLILSTISKSLGQTVS